MGSLHLVTGTREGRRLTISIGARLNTWGLIAGQVVLGLSYLLASPSRVAAPAFRAAKAVAPLPVHGAVFLTLGCALAVAYLTGRFLMAVLLALGAYYVFWTMVWVVALLGIPNASPTAIGPYAFIAWSCFATAQTIAHVSPFVRVIK